MNNNQVSSTQTFDTFTNRRNIKEKNGTVDRVKHDIRNFIDLNSKKLDKFRDLRERQYENTQSYSNLRSPNNKTSRNESYFNTSTKFKKPMRSQNIKTEKSLSSFNNNSCIQTNSLIDYCKEIVDIRKPDETNRKLQKYLCRDMIEEKAKISLRNFNLNEFEVKIFKDHLSSFRKFENRIGAEHDYSEMCLLDHANANDKKSLNHHKATIEIKSKTLRFTKEKNNFDKQEIDYEMLENYMDKTKKRYYDKFKKKVEDNKKILR